MACAPGFNNHVIVKCILVTF